MTGGDSSFLNGFLKICEGLKMRLLAGGTVIVAAVAFADELNALIEAVKIVLKAF